MVETSKPKVALILGAGFSREAGLPDAKGVVTDFLQPPHNGHLPFEIEEEISKQLKAFWKYAFNYDRYGKPPSLEDHFTVLDLAANTGRNIGPEYTPKKLRAIRRLSIHRIFQILNLPRPHSLSIENLLRTLTDGAEMAVVSTNWDRVVENHLRDLGVSYWYGVPVESLEGIERTSEGTKLLMLHGSANWIYCDSCRRLYAEDFGKSALDAFIYIARDDFNLLCPRRKKILKLVEGLSRNDKCCFHCKGRLSARIATFSYRKEISIPQFQTVWQSAFATLRDSNTWVFLGYSLPDADFEFRHLLKSAEKAATQGVAQKIVVVLKDDCKAAERFRRFFGIRDRQIHQCGISGWMSESFTDWVQSNLHRST